MQSSWMRLSALKYLYFELPLALQEKGFLKFILLKTIRYHFICTFLPRMPNFRHKWNSKWTSISLSSLRIWVKSQITALSLALLGHLRSLPDVTALPITLPRRKFLLHSLNPSLCMELRPAYQSDQASEVHIKRIREEQRATRNTSSFTNLDACGNCSFSKLSLPITNVTLPSLPDSVLTYIFDQLAMTRRTAAAGRCQAYLLGSTCRRLDKFYREEYVTRLSYYRMNNENPAKCIGMLFRYLTRYPAIETLHLGQCSWLSDNVFKKAARLLTVQGHRKRKTGIREIDISNTPITDDALRDLMWVCPSLKSLNISQCMLLSDRGLNFVINCVSSSLQELFADRILFSSSVGCRLQELRHLLLLDLSGNSNLSDADFISLGKLTSLTELSLSETKVTNFAAGIMLSSLSNLKLLDITACRSVTSDILYSLPASLMGLKLNETDVLCGRMVMSKYTFLPCLRELRARMCRSLVGMSELNHFAPGLETLDLCDNTSLVDCETFQMLCGLRELQHLNISGCTGISDMTLQAAMHLPELISLDLSFTSIECRSLMDLQMCNAKESLRVLDICGCEGINSDNGVLTRMQGALPYCYIRGPIRWNRFFPEEDLEHENDQDCDRSAEEIAEMLMFGEIPKDAYMFQCQWIVSNLISSLQTESKLRGSLEQEMKSKFQITRLSVQKKTWPFSGLSTSSRRSS